MDAAVKSSAAQAQFYQRRRPETTLWYRTVQMHFETWLALTNGPGDESTPAYIEQGFRRYLDCGILANGFARARCDECGHDFLIAFSCKGRGVCPSCITRRMAETAAHLTDHVFPACRYGNGYSPCPNACATFCNATPPCKALCCAFCYAG